MTNEEAAQLLDDAVGMIGELERMFRCLDPRAGWRKERLCDGIGTSLRRVRDHLTAADTGH